MIDLEVNQRHQMHSLIRRISKKQVLCTIFPDSELVLDLKRTDININLLLDCHKCREKTIKYKVCKIWWTKNKCSKWGNKMSKTWRRQRNTLLSRRLQMEDYRRPNKWCKKTVMQMLVSLMTMIVKSFKDIVDLNSNKTSNSNKTWAIINKITMEIIHIRI